MPNSASTKLWPLALSLSVASLTACAIAPTSADGSDVEASGPAAVASSALQVQAIEGTANPSAAAAAGTLFLVGSIKDTSAVAAAVPGVAVNLTGAATKVSNANSNGVYRFSNLAAGSYTATPVKAGATFSPTNSTFTLGSDKEVSFTCVSGCEGAATVNPLKEITIVDPSVMNDARASSAGGTPGHWSFRFLMEQMTPAGVDPADFVANWIQGFRASAGPVNGFAVLDRSVNDPNNGLTSDSVWPKRADGKLDLSKAPFKLLAIVNRTDLHEIGDGEGRLIFGMNQNGSGQSFTVIFEYRLPTKDAAGVAISRLSWINQFHALGGLPFDGTTFNANLQAITDKFTSAGAVPTNPNGNAISQVRSNEIRFGSPWQLREFHLVNNASGQGFLKLSQPGQTPDDSFNNSSALANYITTNRFRVIGGIANVTNSFIGGQSNENFFGTPNKVWSFTSFPAVDEQARHAFSGQTCNGCHNGETSQIDNFYHVSPLSLPGPDGTANVSNFIKNNEFPRRRRFMLNRLVCKPDFSDCSPGAEPLL